jgi:tetratricopeptide (TPR) repeat protein
MVFRRLGVFAGSFTLEGAQYVAQDANIDGWAALDHLGALVDKSLVLAEGDPVPRYRLLETTRAYALERLGEARETALTLRRHAEALLQRLLAIEQDVELRRPKNSGFDAAAPELDNLRAALAWVATADDCDALALSLAGHSLCVWQATDHLSEGLERCLALRRRVHDGLPPAVAARFWLTIGGLGLYGTRRESYDAAGLAVELYRSLGDARHLFDALVSTAVQGVRFGTTEDMGRAVQEAEQLVRPEWPALQRARLEFARGRWLARQHRIEESLAAAEQQAAICERDGNELGVHYAMSNVVAAENQLGRFEIALAHARHSITRLEAIGGAAGAGHLWLGVMNAEALLGRADAALAAGRTAYTLLLREGDELRVFWGFALCAALQGRPAEAARIMGYVDEVLARAGTVQEAHWTTITARLSRMLDAALSPDELARLRGEGAAMREEEAVRLALGPDR